VPYPERLETARLLLRRWRPTDADAFAAIWADPEVWRALRPDEDADQEAVAAASFSKHVRHWEEHGFGLWAAVPRGERDPVGWVGAWLPDFVPDLAGEIEIAWTLRREFWGHGLATEGARAAADHALRSLAANRVISLIAPANHRSASVAVKLGMSDEGRTVTRDGMELELYSLAR